MKLLGLTEEQHDELVMNEAETRKESARFFKGSNTWRQMRYACVNSRVAEQVSTPVRKRAKRAGTLRGCRCEWSFTARRSAPGGAITVSYNPNVAHNEQCLQLQQLGQQYLSALERKHLQHTVDAMLGAHNATILRVRACECACDALAACGAACERRAAAPRAAAAAAAGVPGAESGRVHAGPPGAEAVDGGGGAAVLAVAPGQRAARRRRERNRHQEREGALQALPPVAPPRPPPPSTRREPRRAIHADKSTATYVKILDAAERAAPRIKPRVIVARLARAGQCGATGAEMRACRRRWTWTKRS